MENITSEIKEKAQQVCCDYLGGMWQNISQSEMIITKLSGGYGNLTFKLSLPHNYKPINEEPNQVLMKIHLDMLGEGYFRQMTENIIAVSLAEKNLAPKVYGIFDCGRLDEYIISRPLVRSDLRNPNIISVIAQKMAHLHSMTLPISKDPNKMFNQAKKLIHNIIAEPINEHEDPKRKTAKDKFIELNPLEELQWLKEIIDTLDLPVVYCHGDLQLNNILLQETSLDEPIIHIIDLDISGYNYRGVDFASLFNSFCMELPSSEPPYFKFHQDQAPTIEEQKSIFTIYLKEFQNINNVTLDLEKEIDLLLKETKVFTVMSVLYFCPMFLLLKGDTMANTLDWLEAAHMAVNRYEELKQTIISDN